MSNLKVTNATLVGLFYASIPMMPIFTMYGFYTLGIAVVFVYIIHIFKGKVKIQITFFEILYGCFILWNAISLFWSVSGEKSVIKWQLIYFGFIFAAIRLSYFYFKNMDLVVEHFIKYFVGATTIISIYCLCIEHPFYEGASRLGTYVFREPYGTRMTYTYSLEISIFIILFLILARKRLSIDKTKIYFILLSIFSFCAIMSGTRKIFIGIAAFILVSIFLEDKEKLWKMLPKLIALCIVAILMYYAVMNVPVLYNSLGKRLETAMIYFETGSWDGSLRDRDAMVQYAILKFKENPWLGQGSNAFHYLFYRYYGQDLYAHNTFVELLCDVGIIGFTIYYLIYVFIIFNRNRGKYQNLFASMLTAILILDYWTISYYRIHFMLPLSLAAFYAMIKNKKIK